MRDPDSQRDIKELIGISEVEELPCPACGTKVKTSGGPTYATADFFTGEVASHSRETINCPNCGRLLRRDILPGAPWRLADG